MITESATAADNLYENPLVTRYGSKEMNALFSQNARIELFRRLWTELAEAESELGLPVSPEQVAEMRRFISNIDFEAAAAYEKKLRHDVMAHIKAFGAQAKSAAPIIHLGATSCFVTDNADLIIYNRALKLIKKKLAAVMFRLKDFAERYKGLPCLGYTHLQPAQLTTVGKRAALWLQDIVTDYEALEFLLEKSALRGVKGTTGTQASFLTLFNGDHEKVKELEKRVAKKLGISRVYAVTGQTYPRKYDYSVLCALSQIAQSAMKFSGDLRLLQAFKEIEEPFEKEQVGSSAMAYKRNPMRSERITSLARFVMTLPLNAAFTAGTQWLERTLDDSAGRRIVMGQAFLAADGILDLYADIAGGLEVYESVIAARIGAELPFMATEEILMEAVKAGGDRQMLHEAIRSHSMESAKKVKKGGGNNDLIERLKGDPLFAAISADLNKILRPESFIGRAEQQTEEFLNEVVEPILKKNKKAEGYAPDITV